MKTFKKILLGIIIFFIISSIIGYFYFERKFTPDPNYLNVSQNSDTIPMVLIGPKDNPIEALLLPIKLKNENQIFYMQFDFGSPYTLFYKKTLLSLQKTLAKNTFQLLNKKTLSLEFNLGKITIQSNRFKNLDYGESINNKKNNQPIIIGTIGADILEKKTLTMDFKNKICVFNEPTLQNQGSKKYFEIEFTKRKILIPSTINGISYDLLYDSGTSAFELITSKEIFEKLSDKKQKAKIGCGNSFGRQLTTFTKKCNTQVHMGTYKLPLTEVTHIEGVSTMQYLLMKFSGMGGMIGNKIFMKNKVIIDVKNKKMAIE